jgi:hypothetical protein
LQLIQREEEERKRGATKALPVSTPLLDDLRAKKLAKLRKACEPAWAVVVFSI